MARDPRPDRPSLDPEFVATQTFSSSFRGFDTAEVRGYLEVIAGLLRDGEQREEELTRSLADAEERLAHPPPLDEHQLTVLLGEETTRVIETARHAASEIRSKAEENAARLVREAIDEAAASRTSAEESAALILTELERETAAQRTAAEEYASQIRGEADDKIAQQLAEADAESARMRAEAESVLAKAESVLAERTEEAEQAAASVRAEADATSHRGGGRSRGTPVHRCRADRRAACRVLPRWPRPRSRRRAKRVARWWPRPVPSANGCSPTSSNVAGSVGPSSSSCVAPGNGCWRCSSPPAPVSTRQPAIWLRHSPTTARCGGAFAPGHRGRRAAACDDDRGAANRLPPLRPRPRPSLMSQRTKQRRPTRRRQPNRSRPNGSRPSRSRPLPSRSRPRTWSNRIPSPKTRPGSSRRRRRSRKERRSASLRATQRPPRRPRPRAETSTPSSPRSAPREPMTSIGPTRSWST